MMAKALVAMGLLVGLLLVGLLAGSVQAQTAAPGWTLAVHATNVSTVSGGEALAADLATGDIYVKSLQDPGGFNVQLARVAPSGTVTNLATFPSVRNSDVSGIAIDPLTGGIIVADQSGLDGRIAQINLPSLTVSTLFDLPWLMNPAGNGTGQQQYAPDQGNPNILYFWDSSLSKLFRLDRSTNTFQEILALDQGTAVGQHLSTFINDIVFDPATGTLLLTDDLSNSVLEVDPSTAPATVTTLFSGFTTPTSIALNPLTNQVFVVEGFTSIFVGPLTGGPLSLVASGFTFLTDIVVGKATNGTGLSLFAVDKSLDTVYKVVRTPSGMLSDLTAIVTSLGFQQAINLLQNVLKQINAGNIAPACNMLDAFINQVQAQSGQQLTLAQADQLIALANQIRAALGC